MPEQIVQPVNVVQSASDLQAPYSGLRQLSSPPTKAILAKLSVVFVKYSLSLLQSEPHLTFFLPNHVSPELTRHPLPFFNLVLPLSHFTKESNDCHSAGAPLTPMCLRDSITPWADTIPTFKYLLANLPPTLTILLFPLAWILALHLTTLIERYPSLTAKLPTLPAASRFVPSGSAHIHSTAAASPRLIRLAAHHVPETHPDHVTQRQPDAGRLMLNPSSPLHTSSESQTDRTGWKEGPPYVKFNLAILVQAAYRLIELDDSGPDGPHSWCLPVSARRTLQAIGAQPWSADDRLKRLAHGTTYDGNIRSAHATGWKLSLSDACKERAGLMWRDEWAGLVWGLEQNPEPGLRVGEREVGDGVLVPVGGVRATLEVKFILNKDAFVAELKEHVIHPFFEALKQEGQITLKQMMAKSSEAAREAVRDAFSMEEQQFESEQVSCTTFGALDLDEYDKREWSMGSDDSSTPHTDNLYTTRCAAAHQLFKSPARSVQVVAADSLLFLATDCQHEPPTQEEDEARAAVLLRQRWPSSCFVPSSLASPSAHLSIAHFTSKHIHRLGTDVRENFAPGAADCELGITTSIHLGTPTIPVRSGELQDVVHVSAQLVSYPHPPSWEEPAQIIFDPVALARRPSIFHLTEAIITTPPGPLLPTYVRPIVSLVRAALKNGSGAVFEINYARAISGDGDPRQTKSFSGEGRNRSRWAAAREVVRATKEKGINTTLPCSAKRSHLLKKENIFRP
ncbi:hypothetical protein BV22DRAFT_1045296 [Leucogyrophana mollusca]|uniref:Uncharacterized protein n=1 Tax=Leucogyrophana mollusca TaxID=85980 RepID=A0ACB8BSM6_9AGAM|nr:hypothetical protein BV22DRAFT_1045296 [Leucogyrophana mollusca]